MTQLRGSTAIRAENRTRSSFWTELLSPTWSRFSDGLQVSGTVIRKRSENWKPGGAGVCAVADYTHLVAEIRINKLYGGCLIGMVSNECSMNEWIGCGNDDAVSTSSAWFYDTLAKSFSHPAHRRVESQDLPTLRPGDTLSMHFDFDAGELRFCLNRSTVLGTLPGVRRKLHPAAFLFADGTELELVDVHLATQQEPAPPQLVSHIQLIEGNRIARAHGRSSPRGQRWPSPSAPSCSAATASPAAARAAGPAPPPPPAPPGRGPTPPHPRSRPDPGRATPRPRPAAGP